MTPLPHCQIVVLQLTDISIKLLKYRSKWTCKANTEQKLSNMKWENTLDVRLVNFVFCLLSAITFMLLKYPLVDNWLYYRARKPATMLYWLNNLLSTMINNSNEVMVRQMAPVALIIGFTKNVWRKKI